ncbi:MAG: DUF4010 domain-containing protein [Nocardioides sp.]|uniref:MgtC/SapB family protein n=1 Tax=Nocardioides sp. TaxID=35761 RepID=UPI003266D1F7
MAELDLWQTLGVALAIGLLIGTERERSKPDAGSPGMRTIALLAVIGAFSVHLPTAVAASIVAGAVLLVVVGYAWSRSRDPGMTSEMAALTALGLGALTYTEPTLAIGAAVAVTVLLASREPLHRFVRETITDQERTDALKLFVAAFIVLPLLPQGHVGPYGAWVPQRIWLLVVLIICIGWVGHAASRALGSGRGLMIGGLAGGFVSGTATTGVMGAKLRRGEAPLRGALAGAVLASLATLVQLVLITTVAEPRVAAALLPAMAAGSTVLAAEAWWLGHGQSAVDPELVRSSRPFALLPALVLAGIISLVLPLAIWLQHRYGDAGAVAATAAGALADVHGASVAMATLVHQGDVVIGTALAAIGAGLATNTAGKLAVAALAGGVRFAALLGALLLPAVVAVAVTLFFA